jgi:hypothetical protein
MSEDHTLDQATAFLSAESADKARQHQVDVLGERVIDVIRTVYDPEIPVNIFELALKVSGQFSRSTADGPGEYSVVVVIRDAKGAELARKVIGVGGLAAGDERLVDLTVEIFNQPGTSWL